MKIAPGFKALALLMSLALALGGGFLAGRHQHGGQETGPAPSGPGQEAAKVQYTCSMHPFIIRDEPGNCPICGMALVPVRREQEGAADSAPEGIRIDPVTLQNMGVRTEQALKRSLSRTVRTVGLVTAADDRQYSVNSKIEGWVEQLHVNRQGQEVRKGQALMELYSPELVASQEEYLLALTNRKHLAASPVAGISDSAERLVAAARTRLKYWDISDAQIRTLEQTGKARKTLTLYSPYDGVVTGKKVVAGMRVMAGEELLQITDLSTVWILADLYEYELPWVRVGQGARIELPYAPGRTIDGTITYLYPYLENESRTVKARIEVANPGMALKPAMYANVAIVAGTVADALTIPQSAVLTSGTTRTVFVALGEGRFAPRRITTGLRDGEGAVQVTDGLAEGEAVVVSAQFLLDSESRLREALGKMAAPQGDQAPAPADRKPDAKDLEDLFQ